MDKRILFGVDSDLSPITQHVLHEAGELVEQATPEVHCILLNVVPTAQVISTHPGLYAGHIFPLAITSWQRNQAEDVVYKARLLLQMQGIPFARTEGIVRVGVPADEIVRAARELQVNLIIIGCHGYSFRERLRRLVLGSISRRVLRLAPCPVMVVSPPPTTRRTTDLVTWYENATRRYLSEHTNELQVFTPDQLAQQFALPDKKKPGRKEKEAARLALEKLARQGVLCCHQIQGELRYVND
jgi:nucleotide-binding universal stress UspA family protein